MKHDEVNIPESLLKEKQTPVENEIEKVNNRKSIKQLTREKIKLDNKELAKQMINPLYFTDIKLKNTVQN